MKFLKYILGFVYIFFINSSFTQTTLNISVNPTNNICSTASVTFNSSTNCNSPIYQWYVNSIAISGATISTFTPTSLSNGDTIYLKQLNNTAPCALVTSNKIVMFIQTPPSLILISSAGTNNQTICQNDNINPIIYKINGNFNSVQVNNLPSGITYTLNGDTIKINGSSNTLGSFNYSITVQSAFCGQITSSNFITVIQKIIPTLISGASLTTLSTFNGQDYIVRCNSTSQANVILANGLSSSDTNKINQYKIVWGDGSPDTSFYPFNTNILHSYPNGSYQLTISATHNSTGCIGTKTYGVFIGNSPSGNLANLGNLSGCIPKTIKFPINNTVGNIPGTKYVIKFGDGDSIVYIHPLIPDTVSHTYIRTSCGNIPSTGPSNTFAATMLVTNPCGNATSTVSNIEINEPPTANFFLIPNKICNTKSLSIVNSSSNGFVVTGIGCTNSAKKYWTISPSTGWSTTNNLGSNGGNPNDIDLWTTGENNLNINFTQPGLYYIKIHLGNGCSGISTKLDSVRVNPNPPLLTVNSPVIYCQNAIADTLTATPLPGNILKWYTVANGGVGSFSSPTSSTSASGNTTYWVSQVTPEGCEGPRIALVVTVNPTPIQPTVTTPINYCHNAISTSLVATGSSGITIKWYTQATGGTSSTTAPIPSTAIVGTFYFYATQTNSFNCESPRREIKVTINPNPTAPSVVSPISLCQNSFANALTATANSGNSLLWYTTSSGGIGNSASPTPSTSIVGSTDYFVSQVTPFNCQGTRATLTVNINLTPLAPSITNPITYCQGAITTTLTATANSSNTLLWYTSSSGGTGSTTAPTPSSTIVGSNNFYVSEVNSNNCQSPRALIEVVINETPTPPNVISPVQLCQNQSTNPLIATPNTNNTLLWYNDATGGVGASTAPTPNTSSLGSINYFVSQITPKNCEGPRAQITVEVNLVPVISNTTSNNPTLCATADGSISLYGLTAATTYTVTYTKNGTPQSATITANSSSVATLTNLLAGTYTNIKVVLNGCSSNIVGPIILSDPNSPNTPAITAVNNICSGKNLSLAASTSSSGIATYNWSGPNGFTSSVQNPTITSISTAYSGTYNVTVTINNCTSLAGTKNVTVDPTPQKPTIFSNSPVCKDSTLFLTANTASPGIMTYNWTGPNSFSSAIQSPSIIAVSNVHAGVYNVTATSIANCISVPQNSTVQVNPVPIISATTFNNPTLCALADGSISLYGLTASTTYAVTYTINGIPQSTTITANSSAVATLTSLLAGTYANITVVLNGCSSNIVGPITLSDPNPPNTPTITAVNNICSGNTLNLAASTTTSGTATYNWTGPNSFSASIQNPSITSVSIAYSGTYSVTVTINNCTSAAGTKNIVVDSTPQQPTITSNTPVCKDSTLFLNATSVSSGSMTYNWTGPNSFSSAIQNPPITNITNANAGVYNVTATSIANCISVPQNLTVQVNPTPVINSRNDTIYNDNVNSGTISFSANLPGTQFSWTNNNTSIGLAASGSGAINFTTVNPSANLISGLITVTPILNGCPGLPFSFTIRVNPSPKLSSSLKDSICTNNLFTYQATSATNNVKFTWIRNVVAGISNAANSSSDSTGLINETLINTTTAPKIVTYQFKLYHAGNISIQNVQLIVYPKAKAQFTYTKFTLCAPGIFDSSIIKLNHYDSANISYQWYANNVLLGTSNYFPGFTINNPNTSIIIKLKAISKYGCLNDSFSHQFSTFIKPTVSFTKSTTQGCGPLSVNFTNTTTPLNLPKYLWVFGNGDSSTAIQPPTIIFKEDTNSNRKDTVYYVKLYAYTVCDTLMYLDSVIVHPKPKALFQPNATTGCSVFAFSAVNNSWGSGNTYNWDFGDNTFLNDTAKINVTHNYSTLVTDTFTVKLIANNVCGADTFTVNIVVFPNTIVPKLILDGNTNFSCAPANLKFVNNSTGANKFTINFGDGSFPLITFKTPDTLYHTYTSGGIFNVTMKAENNCTDSTVSQIIQLYNKPIASFTSISNQYCKKQPIVFSNTSDTSLSYEWIFGDGSTSINYTPTHVYNAAGPYTVTLIVKSVNPSGAICTDTARKSITINELPSSVFTDNSIVNNCQPFNYIGITTQPIGNISNWTFTDSYSVDTTMFGNTGIHTFTNPGTFNIKLIVFTPAGCSDTTNKTVKVVERPKANFSMSDTVSCVPGKLVNFTNLFTYTALDAVNFEWYIDNVLIATTRNLAYTFTTSINISTAKIFTIKSIVINSFGCKDSMTKTFTVLPKAKPSFTVSAVINCNPITLQINNSSLYSNIYKWYLDGQLFSTTANPTPIVLNQPTTLYTIKLVADHTLGCGSDSTVQQFTTPSNPVAAFNIPIKTSCFGILNIQCNNASTVVGANIIKWFWNFGDGTTDTLTNTTHTYTNPGRYVVSLQVQDDRGCLSPITSKTVTNFGKPNSNFSINNACVLNPAIPVNLSTPGFGSTNITNYLWSFGDGTFAIGRQPIHVYLSEGLYTIYLVTTSDSSCVADTFSQKITVYGKPIADFKFQNNCVQVNTFFTNKSLPGYGQNNIANSKWSFGDGGSGTNLNATHIYNAVGNYSVKLTVSGNQCPNLFDSVTKVVPILAGRTPVTYPRVDGVRGVPIQLNALSGGVGYLWNPNLGLNSDIIQNPIATYGLNAPNIINYNIEITDSIGCTVTDKQTVWLFVGSDVYLPSAFSPNTDGANDLFKPFYVNIYRLHYFRIFDRWGKLLFETSDMNKAWDGTFNGQKLPVDTYAWVILGNGENGKEVIRKGNVTLIKN